MIGLVGQVIQTAAATIGGKAKRAHERAVLKARESAGSIKDEIALGALLLLLFVSFIPDAGVQAAVAEGWRIWAEVTPREFRTLTVWGIASALGLDQVRKLLK